MFEFIKFLYWLILQDVSHHQDRLSEWCGMHPTFPLHRHRTAAALDLTSVPIESSYSRSFHKNMRDAVNGGVLLFPSRRVIIALAGCSPGKGKKRKLNESEPWKPRGTRKERREFLTVMSVVELIIP